MTCRPRSLHRLTSVLEIRLDAGLDHHHKTSSEPVPAGQSRPCRYHSRVGSAMATRARASGAGRRRPASRHLRQLSRSMSPPSGTVNTKPSRPTSGPETRIHSRSRSLQRKLAKSRHSGGKGLAAPSMSIDGVSGTVPWLTTSRPWPAANRWESAADETVGVARALYFALGPANLLWSAQDHFIPAVSASSEAPSPELRPRRRSSRLASPASFGPPPPVRARATGSR